MALLPLRVEPEFEPLNLFLCRKQGFSTLAQHGLEVISRCPRFVAFALYFCQQVSVPIALADCNIVERLGYRAQFARAYRLRERGVDASQYIWRCHRCPLARKSIFRQVNLERRNAGDRIPPRNRETFDELPRLREQRPQLLVFNHFLFSQVNLSRRVLA